MAAASNIVINDGQSTPAAHTFVPSSKNGSVVEWLERTTAHTAGGFYTLTTSQTQSSTSPVYRQKIRMAIPMEVFDSTTSTYSYPDTMRVNVDLIIPTSAVALDRDNLAAYVKNLLAHATIQNMIGDLDAPF